MIPATPKPVSWKRKFVIALAALASLIALYYGICDWRGARAWAAYKRDFEARVASLEYKSYIPKPVPETENFGATPIVQSWMQGPSAYGSDGYEKASSLLKPSGPSVSRTYLDLPALREAFTHTNSPKGGYATAHLDRSARAEAAPTVLKYLQADAAKLEELRVALKRPLARYPLSYDLENPWGTLLPHLTVVRQSAIRLKVRACAELACDQGSNGFADADAIFVLAQTLKDEPTIISQLVRVAVDRFGTQVLWEGFADHRWNDEQLRGLEQRLRQFDLLTGMQLGYRAERAMGVLTADLVQRRGPDLMYNIYGIGSAPGSAIGGLMHFAIPSGWYSFEKLNYCRGSDEMLSSAVIVESKRIFPHQLHTNRSPQMNMAQVLFDHHILERFLLPDLSGLPLKMATAQTEVDQALTACALERYRLAEGHYPDALESVRARFIDKLPTDLFTGEPFRYRRNGARFVLYSVGWNELDDGGTPGNSLFDSEKGDWIWEYPAP